MSYDIALLRLESPLKFNEKVAPIKLPEKDDEFNGTAKVSGWGELGIKDKMSAVLQIETVPMFDNLECLDILEIYAENYNKNKNQTEKDNNIDKGDEDLEQGNKTSTTENPLNSENEKSKDKVVPIIYLAQKDSLCTGPLTGGISVCNVSFCVKL